MSKKQYSWSEITEEEGVGAVAFKNGNFLLGDLDVDEIRWSKLPNSELFTLTHEEWEKVNSGEQIRKELNIKKTFIIERQKYTGDEKFFRPERCNDSRRTDKRTSGDA